MSDGKETVESAVDIKKLPTEEKIKHKVKLNKIYSNNNKVSLLIFNILI